MGTELLARLRAFDTPTICNTIELFDMRPRTQGYLDGRIRACFPEMPAIVGYAATATFRGTPVMSGADGYATMAAQVERFVELSGPPILVFQDVDDPPVAATFGEIMCSTYQAFGACGLVTSGASRDLEQVRALGFPVFASCAICAHGYSTILRVHEPVSVGGLVIYPNDLLHADCNGVTTIPREIAADLADVAAEYVASEAIILEVLRDASPTVGRLAQAHAEAQARMDAIRLQVAARH